MIAENRTGWGEFSSAGFFYFEKERAEGKLLAVARDAVRIVLETFFTANEEDVERKTGD